MTGDHLTPRLPDADREIGYLEEIEDRLEEVYFAFWNLVALEDVDEAGAREQVVEMMRQTARRLFPSEGE
jgi:hypothetical protein